MTEFKAEVVEEKYGTWIRLTNESGHAFSFPIQNPIKNISVLVKTLQKYLEETKTPRETALSELKSLVKSIEKDELLLLNVECSTPTMEAPSFGRETMQVQVPTGDIYLTFHLKEKRNG
jgi:hypothetical protein